MTINERANNIEDYYSAKSNLEDYAQEIAVAYGLFRVNLDNEAKALEKDAENNYKGKKERENLLYQYFIQNYL